MRRIYFLPNLFTTANMFCGFYATIAAIHGNYFKAAIGILIAMVFDLMDGRVARMARATSAFGVEYDSLADLLSFGIAPALMVYLWCLQPFGRLGWLVSFLYVACAALRLARFNVSVNALPKRYFQGLPSPVAAATVATAVIFYQEMGLQWPKAITMLFFTFILALLMISTIRFPSFKEVRFGSHQPFGGQALCILTLILIAVKPEMTLFILCLIYIIFSTVWEFIRIVFRRHDKNVVVGKGAHPIEK